MFGYFPARQLAAVIVALGVFLSGAAPCWAASMAGDTGSMPGMSGAMIGMDDNCMQMAGKAGQPAKHTDTSCAICTACAVNIVLTLDLVPVPVVYFRASGLSRTDARPDGIATPPALPPPISRA
jgi:hypothetical protein